MTTKNCPPGGHSHSDKPNFTVDDYLAMCAAGEAKFTISEAARLIGCSRAQLYRWILFARTPVDVFEEALKAVLAKGLTSDTAMADEIRRRTAQAKEYSECCPHCGGELRKRLR